jgi:hypothetical protein
MEDYRLLKKMLDCKCMGQYARAIARTKMKKNKYQ